MNEMMNMRIWNIQIDSALGEATHMIFMPLPPKKEGEWCMEYIMDAMTQFVAWHESVMGHECEILQFGFSEDDAFMGDVEALA
tara:strand:+ start:705 stop:953 length:249 start_codon:yes stop_codon:yes gene_type:complete